MVRLGFPGLHAEDAWSEKTSAKALVRGSIWTLWCRLFTAVHCYG
jgi:hypothetical protein